MSDNDQAAVEALCNLTMQEGDNRPYALHTWKGDERATAARAILDAIRKGEVPIPGTMTAKECAMVRCQVKILQGLLDAAREIGRKAQMEADVWRAEVEQLRVTVTGLTKACDDMEHNADHSATVARDEKARADKAEAGQLVLIAEMNELRASIDDDRNHAVSQMTGYITAERDALRHERDHLLEKAKEYEGRAIGERCRADKAAAERDRLAGLLDDVVSGVETLLLPHWPKMMRKVVKGAMVGRHGLAHVAARAALAEVGKP